MNFIVFFLSLLIFSNGYGQNWLDPQGNPVELHSHLANIPKGSIIVLGESHNHLPHQELHLQILRTLKSQGHSLTVAFEFFDYTQQDLVTQFHKGEISEEEFLSRIQWKNGDFKFYRDRARFADVTVGEDLLGLNLPRWISSQIAKKGLENLEPEAQKLLPPNFTLGNDLYYQRFLEIMNGHDMRDQSLSPKNKLDDVPGYIKNMFVAQCSWDDTMAWVTNQYILKRPEQTVVIIVGDFHVQYGGGLPDRLKSRLASKEETRLKLVYPISFVRRQDYDNEKELHEALHPHPVYGERGFLIGID